jgi:hypothetical protein
MEDWQNKLFAVLETTAVEIDHFFREVGEAIEDVAEEIGETIEDINDQLQDTVFLEIDRYLNELFSSAINFENDLDSEDLFNEELNHDLDLLRNPKIQPDLVNHPACVGCHHYHGQVYGGNLLVCGMHPYGWDGENCPDWEEEGMINRE